MLTVKCGVKALSLSCCAVKNTAHQEYRMRALKTTTYCISFLPSFVYE